MLSSQLCISTASHWGPENSFRSLTPPFWRHIAQVDFVLYCVEEMTVHPLISTSALNLFTCSRVNWALLENVLMNNPKVRTSEANNSSVQRCSFFWHLVWKHHGIHLSSYANKWWHLGVGNFFFFPALTRFRLAIRYFRSTLNLW